MSGQETCPLRCRILGHRWTLARIIGGKISVHAYRCRRCPATREEITI